MATTAHPSTPLTSPSASAPRVSGEALRQLTSDLARALGRENVLAQPADLLAYEYDGSFLEGSPDLVALPASPEEVATAVRLATAAGVPVVARGSGTGLCGAAIPARGGLVISTSRLNHIREIDVRNRRAVVEPGVVNLDLSTATRPHGLYYAPDPASQKISTIGGNVATNAGGPHCLAYGVTTNHILALQVVLHDGQLVWLGDPAVDSPGYDLTGALVGSEGTLAVVTQIVVRLLRVPEAVRTLLAIYPGIAEASATVSAIIAAGILPSALEMMDRLVVQAVERHFHAGYPSDAGCVLLIELEGAREAVDLQQERVERLCAENGATEVRRARSDAERAALWAGRKGAAGAFGQLSPNYYLQDAVVPRSRLPKVMSRLDEIASAHRITIANVFHAGDGNLHPAMLFDRRKPGDIERVIEAGNEVLRTCVDLGGTISGEHGIGMEKREALSLVFSTADLAAMIRLRTCFDPRTLFNPDKLFPAGASCVEVRDPRLPATAAAPWMC